MATMSDIQQELSRKIKDCHICGDVAKSMHFGGVCCDSCKAFFRRSVQSQGYKHFRCGGNKRCSITITSRKFCKYCRFNRCEEVGMMKSWVMNEDERMQLMKSRLTKKYIETGDEDALRDKSLFTTYHGRVALTAGGAPNLHGLNRRRHMECRMREEGEVDPTIYGSAIKKSKSGSDINAGESSGNSGSSSNVNKGAEMLEVKRREGAPKRGRPRKHPLPSKLTSADKPVNTNSNKMFTSQSTEKQQANSSDLPSFSLTPTPSPEERMFPQSDCNGYNQTSIEKTLSPDYQSIMSTSSDDSGAYVNNDRFTSNNDSSNSNSIVCLNNKSNGSLENSNCSIDFGTDCSKTSQSPPQQDNFQDIDEFDEYGEMINARPNIPITQHMTIFELGKLKKIISTMNTIETMYPYEAITSSSAVMPTYIKFISRVIYFVKQFEEFYSLPSQLQNELFNKNITTIALMFGSSFANHEGTYTNVLRTPSVHVMKLNDVKGALTPNVYSAFSEVQGILSKFKVDVRMAYMIVFMIIFRYDVYPSYHMCYKNLLYRYICWKYGSNNAEYINLNLTKTLDGISKHAHIFEAMATKCVDDNVEKAKIVVPEATNCADNSISKGFDINFGQCTPSASPEQNRKYGISDMGVSKFEKLRNMFRNGASEEDLKSEYFSGASSSDNLSLSPSSKSFYSRSFKSSPSASSTSSNTWSTPNNDVPTEFKLEKADSMFGDNVDNQSVSMHSCNVNDIQEGSIDEVANKAIDRLMLVSPPALPTVKETEQERHLNSQSAFSYYQSKSKEVQAMIDKHGRSQLQNMFSSGQIGQLREMFQNTINNSESTAGSNFSKVEFSNIPNDFKSYLPHLSTENANYQTVSDAPSRVDDMKMPISPEYNFHSQSSPFSADMIRFYRHSNMSSASSIKHPFPSVHDSAGKSGFQPPVLSQVNLQNSPTNLYPMANPNNFNPFYPERDKLALSNDVLSSKNVPDIEFMNRVDNNYGDQCPTNSFQQFPMFPGSQAFFSPHSNFTRFTNPRNFSS